MPSHLLIPQQTLLDGYEPWRFPWNALHSPLDHSHFCLWLKRRRRRSRGPTPERRRWRRPDTTNPAAPVPGANSFTEGQAKDRIESKGYSEVTALTKGADGIWNASAKKDGKAVAVQLDYQGNISEPAK